MADQQRVHPGPDPEAALPQTPSDPLVPHGASKSDKGDPADYPPPAGYAIAGAALYPGPKPQKKKRSCCCRFLCWTLLILLILVIAIGATVGILFLVFRPKLPKYSIDGLQVKQFNLSNNGSLSAAFDVNVTARNPNKKIGIYYVGGSRLSVLYSGSKLSEGSFPTFYQGHQNTTVLQVPLTGQTQNATALLETVQTQLQQTGVVPLNLRVRQPVRIKLGKLKLPKMRFLVRCRLEVNNLSSQNTVSLKSSSCTFRFRRLG
ncbi:hypothetical protein SAY87_025634 [Trapa incisa]|uniref:Late embryogenesis abundant protein LEA-2 subgroup domain-containing protein n=1 Tax=Trapa incisa TaxID=236973 RepID=A0AAN7GU39_9MYRT|nr:hypothetical protein SAY87_025634 [Trapa incisa]